MCSHAQYPMCSEKMLAQEMTIVVTVKDACSQAIPTLTLILTLTLTLILTLTLTLTLSLTLTGAQVRSQLAGWGLGRGTQPQA